MAANSEKGYEKNRANLGILISFFKGYGSKYNPINPLLKISALEILDGKAAVEMKSVADALAPYAMAVDAREEAFAPLNKLTTKINYALSSSGLSKKLLEDAQTHIRKIKGTRKSKKALDAFIESTHEGAKTTAPTDTNQPKQISNSHLSYDNRAENLYALGTLLQSEPAYTPNEVELQTGTLLTLCTNLKTLNKNVNDVFTPLSNARVKRYKLFNDDVTGLCDIGKEAKNYVKSVFGVTSKEYKQISKLTFTKA
ncbi:MAG: hypothetical protein A2275_18800 [Bacteroidetes bacterium RIFOXYA12_FULL_35_11]|nr:MAG: hypothetical protein A2X01_14430 [Bacteroidetes bacterium GWF2_35_48]OFY76832.1 MAG: hypothetical protein A2275_18800 [Bacteroidetes bacterium RIFOXYA12_FULL_35_11]OFY97705.1 MAG: hypothetical protein A2491_17005 [Bacteroidetes bacterium RIFOXYC12_FULL_35_7]